MIWSGVVWSVPARCGAAGLGRGITAGHGKAMFSEVWRSMVWHGYCGRVRSGSVRCGEPWLRVAWQGIRGEAGRGVV